MEAAIELAKRAQQINEVPIAAVLVQDDATIISAQHNKTILLNDNTMHAEMLALREGTLKLNTRYLSQCDLYVTLEPCQMCMHAISISRIRRLYFGSYNKLKNIWHGTQIYGGFYEEVCSNLLKVFFMQKRNL
ncbi:TadA-like nucleoside deaminase [Candidatus Cyrtobacter comes]|uniref:TadA-like nucleoside deaminase n=2 Tax=Candidatus Cyrtobacter comes TaxID=675776 RepID=A0ABU5L729_9RICK|nr:TadA-like nucleoside deaminase [Candidatus Cyrtobacter comes]